MGAEDDALIRCFKCGKEIKEGEEWVFSCEWDAFCHVKCCPAFNKELTLDDECKVCLGRE